MQAGFGSALVLVDAEGNLGLPLLQLTRSSVVFVLRNFPHGVAMARYSLSRAQERPMRLR
jgi:hypothetical protein